MLPEVNAWVYEGYSPEIAALQEPLGNAVHAAFVEEVAGQTAVVLGCGPIGLMAIGVLKMAGARSVFATDINPERREMAEQMGADLVLDGRDDVAARLRAETDGNGVDIVLEMSGLSSRSPPGPRGGHQRRPRLAPRARTRARRRSTSRRKSSSRASASTASPGGGCSTPGIERRRCSRRAWTCRRSSPTACRCPSTRRLSTSSRPGTPARSCCCPRRAEP